MKYILRFLYCVYQLLICLPVLLIITVITAVFTLIGCTLFDARWWGYYPAMLWSRMMCLVPLLDVCVEGADRIDSNQSYIFVANHQGPFDIFLIYGWLGRPFRWLMKKELANIPLVGRACLKAGHILVDKSGPKAIWRTQEQARASLRDGVSVVVFPEGSRTFTGHMGSFRRGPFQLGHSLQLPIVPITIDGSFQVLPRQKGFNFVTYHTLRMVIHEPIPYRDDMDGIISESYSVIESALPHELQGFRENPDQ